MHQCHGRVGHAYETGNAGQDLIASEFYRPLCKFRCGPHLLARVVIKRERCGCDRDRKSNEDAVEEMSGGPGGYPWW